MKICILLFMGLFLGEARAQESRPLALPESSTVKYHQLEKARTTADTAVQIRPQMLRPEDWNLDYYKSKNYAALLSLSPGQVTADKAVYNINFGAAGGVYELERVGKDVIRLKFPGAYLPQSLDTKNLTSAVVPEFYVGMTALNETDAGILCEIHLDGGRSYNVVQTPSGFQFEVSTGSQNPLKPPREPLGLGKILLVSAFPLALAGVAAGYLIGGGFEKPAPAGVSPDPGIGDINVEITLPSLGGP
jgi:hypothetical protein